MFCIHKKNFLIFTSFLCLLFVLGTWYVSSQKIIYKNRAAEIVDPTPIAIPLYPTEYGVDFTVSNSNLPSIISLNAFIKDNSVFRKNSYAYTNPTLFRLGVFPRKTASTELKSYIYQTDMANYPTLVKDEQVLRYFNPTYPKFGERTQYTQGLPVYNFCHLATLANVIQAFALEAQFMNHVKPLLSEDLQLKNLTLPEVIFYRYYREQTEVDDTPSFHVIDTSGVIANVRTFEGIGERMMTDINAIDPTKYAFSLTNTSYLAHEQSVSHVTLSGLEKEMMQGNTLYIARAKLNGYRDSLGSSTFSAGPTHYLIIADAKSFIYPPVATQALKNATQKTELFLIDPLGKVESSTDLDKSGYSGLGYIGWAGMYYFNGEGNKTYASSTAEQNAMMNRQSGIYSLISVHNSIQAPSPTLTPTSPPSPTPVRRRYIDPKLQRME